VGRKKKKPTKKHGPIKLSQAKRDEMFEVWCERQSIEHVSKKCKVHWNTASRYRKLDNWDERYANIQDEANAKADKKIANNMATRIQNYRVVADAGLNRWLRKVKDQLESGVENPELELTMPDQATLEKLILLLSGEPDSHVLNSGDSSTDPRIERMLDALESKLGPAELAKLADKLADRK